MQISFELCLHTLENSLLQIEEVAKLNSAGTDFKKLEAMSLPAT